MDEKDDDKKKETKTTETVSTKDRYCAESHFMPMPELLTDDPGVYTIIDSRTVEDLPTNGMVDQVNQIMLVPFDAPGRLVSRHECAHVMWTPPRAPRLRGSPAYAQAVEDGRINRGLREIGLGLDLEAKELAHVVELGVVDLDHDKQGLSNWALRTVASYGTNAEQPLLSLIDEASAPVLPFKGQDVIPLAHRVKAVVISAHAKLESARERDGGPVADPRHTPIIARWLRGQLKALELPEPERRGTLVCCFGGASARHVKGSRKRKWRFPFDPSKKYEDGVDSGHMIISEPDLPLAVAPSAKGFARGKRASEEGVIMHEIFRITQDQKIFRTPTRRRRGACSILVDTSGSMSLKASDIDQLIAGAPSATLVAIYSGREEEGELRVVVRDGRRIGVDGLEPYGPANVIDLKALEWLADQLAPRFWISDGGVTGKRDRPSRKVKLECMKVCRRAKIERFDDVAEAARMLMSGR